MKKLYKTLTLSSLAMVMTAAPLVAVVSCGGGSQGSTDPLAQTDLELDDAFGLDPVVVSTAKSYLNSHASDFPELSKPGAATLIESMTPEEMREFSINGEIASSPEKTKLFVETQTFLLKLFFANNANAAFNAGIAKYMNNMALTVNGYSDGRGPWVVDRSKAGAPLYINPDFHRSVNSDGYTILQDSWVTGNATHIFKEWNGVASTVFDDRRSDKAFSGANYYNTTDGIATTFTPIRTKVIGEDKFDAATGKWVSQRSFKPVLEGMSSISVGGQDFTDLTDARLTDALNNSANHDITFNVKPGTKYVKGDGTETTFELKGRDFFLGFIHGLYADVSIREQGLTDASGNTVLPKLSDAELNALKAEYGSAYTKLKNQNFYLYDLYNIDIPATVEANNSLSETDKATKFVVKFKTTEKITPTALQFFTDTSVFSPVSYDYLVSKDASVSGPATDLSTPGAYYGVTTYFPKKSANNQWTDLGEWITVAPYYYSKYDITPTTGSIELVKNPHYADKEFVNATGTIDKYVYAMKADQENPASWSVRSKNAFLNGEELMLDQVAVQDTTITQDIAKNNPTYKTFSKPYTLGYIGNITWNPFGYNAPGYNDLGRKIMFGTGVEGHDVSGKSTEIGSDFDAVEGFFAGNGARLRAAINSGINWYTISQLIFPEIGKTYWQSIYAPEVQINGTSTTVIAGDSVYNKPTYSDDTKHLQEIYDRNMGNQSNQLMTSKWEDACREVEALAAEVGATPQNPARIPYQIKQFTDVSQSQNATAANRIIMETLNKMSPSVKFVEPAAMDWDGFLDVANDNKTGVALIGGFGADYDGLGSLSQQYITTYNANAEIDFIYRILKG